MRVNSLKQTKASRANGSKSKGPKSPAGKGKAAQNAIEDGVFSRQVVIEQLGEKQAEFENIRRTLRDIFQPSNTAEEILVEDFVENWWRRERIRRAESAELRTRVECLEWRNDLRRTDEVEKLRSRFWVLWVSYIRALNSQLLEIGDTTAELEDVRQELVSTSLGIEFLVPIVQYLLTVAEANGVFSPEEEVLLQACCGFGSHDVEICLKLNRINKRESQNWPTEVTNKQEASVSEASQTMANDAVRLALRFQREAERWKAGEGAEPNAREGPKSEQKSKDTETRRDEQESAKSTPKADCCTVLAAAVNIAISTLTARKAQLEMIEATEAKSRNSMTIVDPDIANRFSRAETAVERRMYRALAFLAAMRAGSASNLLP